MLGSSILPAMSKARLDMYACLCEYAYTSNLASFMAGGWMCMRVYVCST